jgi:hypothetical protein
MEGLSSEREPVRAVLHLLAREGPLRVREIERGLRLDGSLRSLLRKLEADGAVAKSGMGKGTTYRLPESPSPSSPGGVDHLKRIREYARTYGGIRRRAAANLCKVDGLAAARLLKALTVKRPGLRKTSRRGVYEWVD